MTTATDEARREPPLLWHLKASHYNEKARWALDHKQVPHTRRAVVPGRHQKIARQLTGGRTFPVLVLSDGAVGDSSRIIEELERRHPLPPLYPSDERGRRAALDLEDFFDEELGPHSRLLLMHLTLAQPGLFLGTFVPDLTGARRLMARAAFGPVRSRVVADFGIDEDRVQLAYDGLRRGGERFRAEVAPSGYLVGDSFTVADLTLAALLAPLVAPAGFPYPQPQRDHPRLAPVREVLDEFGLLTWTREMYRRHRGRSAEVSALP
jgi:glutathione S-transferase